MSTTERMAAGPMDVDSVLNSKPDGETLGFDGKPTGFSWSSAENITTGQFCSRFTGPHLIPKDLVAKHFHYEAELTNLYLRLKPIQ